MQYATCNNYRSSHAKVHCAVPQVSILGPILFVLYMNDLTSVSEYCFSALFADDTNMFITDDDMDVLCHQLNEDLRNAQECLQCSKLSLNVLKTHYMVFTPRIEWLMILMQKFRVFKYRGSMILNVWSSDWFIINMEIHIEYTCKKLSKCVDFSQS